MLCELPAVEFELASKDEEQIVLAADGACQLCGYSVELTFGVANCQITNSFAIGLVEADFDCAFAVAGNFCGELGCALGKIDAFELNPIACVDAGYAKIGGAIEIASFDAPIRAIVSASV